MNTMYRKELRENLRWAALIFLLLILWFGNCIHRMNYGFLGIMDSSFQQASVVGCALAGCALGFLQILQDRRRGRWDFVFHRPLSLQKMFAAKLLAGATLYLLAVGLALAAAIAYLAAPGSVALPFEPGTVLSHVADLLFGLIWYFAAAFAASRRARWIGSRLFPLGFAFMLEAALWLTALNFGIAFAWIAGGFVIFLAVSWFVFGAMGETEKQPIAIRLFIAISVAGGIGMVMSLGAGVLTAVVDLASRGTSQPFYHFYAMLKSGRVVVKNFSEGSIQSITDVNGLPIAGLNRDTIQKQAPSQNTNLSLDAMRHGWFDRVNEVGLFAYRRYFSGMGMANGCAWTWSESRHLIMGYDTDTHVLVAQVGKDGFHSPTETAQPFDTTILLPIEYREQYYSNELVGTLSFVDGDEVWNFDPTHQRLKHLLQVSAGQRLLDTNLLGYGDAAAGDPPSIPAVVEASPDTFYLQGNDGIAFSTPLPPHPPQMFLTIAVLENHRYGLMLLSSHSPTEVLILNESGQIINRQTLPPMDEPDYPTPVLPQIIADILLPPICTPIFFAIDRFYPPQQINGVDWICSAIVALLCPIWTLLLLRRRSLSGAANVYWLVLTFVGGIGAPLLLICTRSRAIRRACPACGKPRLITRELCEHCGQPFLPPAMQGIEIFVVASVDEPDAAGLAAV